jgi:3'5'-cyclic nucleotide phosphodiesterase
VLETHHCSVAIAILSDPRFNVFSGLDEHTHKAAWNMLINAILATDMVWDLHYLLLTSKIREKEKKEGKKEWSDANPILHQFVASNEKWA